MTHFSEYVPVMKNHMTRHHYLVKRQTSRLFTMNSLDPNTLGRFLWQQVELRRTRTGKTQVLGFLQPQQVHAKVTVAGQ